MIIDELLISHKTNNFRRPRKNARGKARKSRGMRPTLCVGRKDEGCSATQHMAFLRGRYHLEVDKH